MKLAPSGFGYLARSPSDGGLACTAILILPRKVYRQIATLIAWENSSSGCRFRSIWWSWNQPRSLFENAFFPKESFCLMQIEPTDAAALCAVLLKDLEAIRRIEKQLLLCRHALRPANRSIHLGSRCTIFTTRSKIPSRRFRSLSKIM